jgi:hypothetical protein
VDLLILFKNGGTSVLSVPKLGKTIVHLSKFPRIKGDWNYQKFNEEDIYSTDIFY